MSHELIPTARRLANFADTFARLQDQRHQADCDPEVRYIRAEVLIMITEVEREISALKGASVRDRTAFAALVMLKNRR